MSKSKYKQGKMIKSMSDFAKSDKTWFKVSFGDKLKTTHRSFLISWQYRTLELFINRGAIYEADKYPDYVSEGCRDCYYNDGEVHAECILCDKAGSEEQG